MSLMFSYEFSGENHHMENEKSKFKNVCVIGAGPAGSLSAFLLQQQGLNVTFIDRYTQPKRKVCGEYLCPLGVELLEDLKLEKVLEGFAPVNGMKIVSPFFTSFLSFFPDRVRTCHGVSVNRQAFDQRLRTLAVDSNCETVFGETVEGINKNGEKWVVKTSNFEREFDLIVAADGIQSVVAKILNHRTKTNTRKIALHCYLNFKRTSDYSRLGQMHIFKDGSYVGINPIDQNEVNFSIVCESSKLKNKDRQELINEYIQNSPELQESFDLVAPNQEVGSAGTLRNKNFHIAGDGIAYVGDSSGFIDPLTGEGMFNALKGAHILSECLSEHASEVGLIKYKKIKKKYFFEKNILNNFFQTLIKLPIACEVVARYLKAKQARANVFVGIIGNIYKPIEGLKKLIFS